MSNHIESQNTSSETISGPCLFGQPSQPIYNPLTVDWDVNSEREDLGIDRGTVFHPLSTLDSGDVLDDRVNARGRVWTSWECSDCDGGGGRLAGEVGSLRFRTESDTVIGELEGYNGTIVFAGLSQQEDEETGEVVFEIDDRTQYMQYEVDHRHGLLAQTDAVQQTYRVTEFDWEDVKESLSDRADRLENDLSEFFSRVDVAVQFDTRACPRTIRLRTRFNEVLLPQDLVDAYRVLCEHDAVVHMKDSRLGVVAVGPRYTVPYS